MGKVFNQYQSKVPFCNKRQVELELSDIIVAHSAAATSKVVAGPKGLVIVSEESGSNVAVPPL
jgi:hypothetical protein